MKKVKLQEEKQVEKRTVQDITYVQDERLKYFAGTVLSAVNRFIDEHNTQQKLKGEEITFEKETQKFVTDLKASIETYAENFAQTKEVKVVKEDIVAEFHELNERMQKLEQDPNIKYIEAKKKFQEMKERQIKLQNFFNQIQKQDLENAPKK